MLIPLIEIITSFKSSVKWIFALESKIMAKMQEENWKEFRQTVLMSVLEAQIASLMQLSSTGGLETSRASEK